MQDDEFKDIMRKYKKRLSEELGTAEFDERNKVTSREYRVFKQGFMTAKHTWYERLCNISEKLIKISPDKNKLAELQKSIDTAHLEVTPAGPTSLAILGPLIYILVTVFITIVIGNLTSGISLFFLIFFVISGLIMIFPLQRMPYFLANNWRLAASNQMVLCVFYIVTYMRHTSNLELAIEFASNHLSGPLVLDLKKVLWDIETEKYSTIKESLDHYLDGWRKYNLEFVEAMHLVESSLFEGSDQRRLELLDKSLDVMLEETYERMLHYAQNLKSPITTLHMLGVILPVLGLVILPLLAAFVGGVYWYHIAMIYNIGLPVLVYYMGKSILAQRPTGYGDSDISTEPELNKYKKFRIGGKNSKIMINPLYLSIFIGVVVLLLGLTPLMMHVVGYENMGYGAEDEKSDCLKSICYLIYREDTETQELRGPYDVISLALSMLVPLALSISIGLYYKIKSKELIKIRTDTKNLEKEFASALFQLGNRLGDGLPAEIAFEKAARVNQDTAAGKFFRNVSHNIEKLGMNVPDAIFDKKIGAITEFPSKIIRSSMKVLIEAIKKGPRIAAQALISMSTYIKEMHRVDERLRDLLADVIASMRSQISYLAPVIAGIVVGITSMITYILGSLKDKLDTSNVGGEASGIAALNFGIGIPSYYFQIVVGIYIVQIVYILTIMSNGIENGTDKLNEEHLLGQNLIRSGLLYCFIAITITIIFTTIAEQVLNRSGVL